LLTAARAGGLPPRNAAAKNPAHCTKYPSAPVTTNSAAMFANALLILPDFATILIGFALTRWRAYEDTFWRGAERLVYTVLFPALLFQSINGAHFSIGAETRLLAATGCAFLGAVALAFAARRLFSPPADVFASTVQTAFRFNSYVGLAVAQSLFGGEGVALFALIVALIVPAANALAVYALAQHRQTRLVRELAGNPLISATMAGLLTNLIGWHPPQPLGALFTRLGQASLALGLLCIGAGLTLTGARAQRRLLVYFSAVKLLALPALACVLAMVFTLDPLRTQLVITFAALPTASSAFVLAARMGGTPAPVAFTVTMQTLVAMITLPIWVSLAPAVSSAAVSSASHAPTTALANH